MAWPKSTATARIVGAILVIARFNPLKKVGPDSGEHKVRPYLDTRVLFVKVGARFPRP